MSVLRTQMTFNDYGQCGNLAQALNFKRFYLLIIER